MVVFHDQRTHEVNMCALKGFDEGQLRVVQISFAGSNILPGSDAADKTTFLNPFEDGDTTGSKAEPEAQHMVLAGPTMLLEQAG